MNMDPWDAAFASPDKALALLDKTDPWDSAYSDPKKALAILNGEPDNEQFARERMANTSLPKWATAGLNEGASDLWSTSLRLGMRSNPVMWAMGKVPIPELPDALQKEMGLKNSPKNIGEMLDERADALNRYSDAFEKAAAETDKGAAGFAAKAARGVSRSLPPALLAGATMGPYGAIGYGVATEANQAVTEGKDAGLTGGQLTAYVTAQGAIEGTVSAIFQKVGLGGMEKIFTKGTGTALKSGFKEGLFEVMKRTGQEIPEELITEAGHAIAKRVAGVEKETDWKNLALDTVAQTALTMGLVETPGLGRLAATEKNRQAMWDQKRAAKTDLAAEMAKPEFAQAWAAENPDLAARMAAIESPSRKDWEDITGSTSRGNPASRKAFADNVRATLGSTSATTPIANDPTPDQTAPQPVEQVTQFSTPKVDYNLKDAPTPARDPRWNYAAPTPEDLSATDGSEEGSVRRLNAIAPPAEQFAIGQADTIELDPINKLKELYPEVANLMPESAGVKEGLTIEQHTRTVLQNFQEQADPAELETLSQALGTNVQRLVEYAIALHDIGKPKAVKLGNKSRQHEFTLPILQDVMKSEGFGEEHIRIASTLVDNDVLGDVLKGRLTAKDALPKIQALAQKAGLPATTFLKLQSMLYKADASAYPAVRAKAFRPINGGQKLRTENTQFGILEEMVYGEVRDNPWIAGTQQTQRTASGQGDGGPRRSADGYVHGTAVKFDEFDANADSGRNLVGRGTYLVTDQDADVAQHYSDRAIKKMMGVFQPKYRDTILNLKPENVGPFLERGNRGARLADAAGNKPLADRFRKAVAVLELVGKGVLGKHVLPVEFSPQNTLVLGSEESGGRALTPTEKQNLEAAAGVKIDKLRAWDFFKAMRAQIGPDATTEAIRKAGYDSIQFVHAKGGYKRPYEVMVALDASAKVKGAPSPAPPPAAPEAASVPQEAATQPTISYLPADLQNAGDDEFEALVKQLGGKPPGKFPKNTYSARLRAQVEEIFAPPKPQVKPQRPPELSPVAPPPLPRNMPVQRAPVAPVPSETANASSPPVTETPQPAPGVAQEAVAPPVDNRIVEERRAAVLAAFRGQATKATELPASDQHRGGYRVEFANGQFVDILHKDTIPGDREGIRRSLVGKLGREPTEEEIASHGPAAAFVVRDDEGRELPGLGAMHIALDTPSATAYRHEALHMARRNGQISVAEWRLLKEKYAPNLNDAEAEERIANSAEAWSDPTIGDRVRAFFHKLLEALGMLDAKTVEALIKTGEVFNRKASRDSGTFGLSRTAPKPSVVHAGEYRGKEKQPAMFTGLNLLPGQQDLLPDMDKREPLPSDSDQKEVPDGYSKGEFKKLREEIRDRMNQEADEWNNALKEVTEMNHGRNSLRNKVRGKFEKGSPGDETNIRGFDLAVEFARGSYPFLLSGKGSDESNLVAAIQKGNRPRVTHNSPEVWQEAWAYAERAGDAREGEQTSGSRDAYPDVPFQVRERPLKWEETAFGVSSATYGRHRVDIKDNRMPLDSDDYQRPDYLLVFDNLKTWEILGFNTLDEAKVAGETILKHHYPASDAALQILYERGYPREFLQGWKGVGTNFTVTPEDAAILAKIEKEFGTDLLGDVVRHHVPAWLDGELHIEKTSAEAKSLMDTIYKYPDAWENIWSRLYELKQNLKHDGKAATQDAFYELVQQINADVSEGAYDTGAMPPAPMYQTRRRRANPGTTPPVRKLVDQHEDTYVPPYRSDAQDDAEVEKRLSDDYEGEKKRLLAFAPGSDYFDRTDVLAAKKIINREAAPAIKRGDQEAIRQAITLIDAYRRQGSEQGAAFRNRRDPIETPDQRVRRNLIEAVLTPPKKDQERIDKALADGNDALAQKIRDDWAKKFGEMKRKLKALGVDLDNLNEYGYDPIRASKALGVVNAQKADAWDIAYEYWRNAILSGPKTQVANVVGTVGNAGWKFLVERPIEAAINSFIGRPEGAQIGEFQHLAAGIMPGLARAARNAMTSFQTEVPELERQLDRDGQFRIEEADVAIGGKLGRGIRMPQRLMLAADEFLKSFVATMDVGAQAYRIAKAEKLSGDAMRRRIEYLVNDLQSHAWTDAHDTALEVSFQQKGSPTAKKLKEGLLKFRKIPGMRYVFPFVTTPVNIFEQGLRKAPITGDLAALKALYDNYKSERPLMTNMTPRMAERVVAWGLALALFAMTGGDDDEPLITGTVTDKNRGARDLARRTYPPQSIRIGNRWFSYSRIEPFATTLALTVDWVNSVRTGDVEKMASTPFRSIFQQMKDKTFLDGVGDLMRIVDAPDTMDEVANYGASFAVSWVPNLVRATSRESGETYAERGVWGKDNERLARLGRRVVQRTELGLIEDRPSIDLWGREAKRGTSPVMGTDIPWRIISPADSRVPDLFVGDKVLLNWNAQHPGEENYPAMPSHKIGDRDMTDEEYEKFLRISGGAAKVLVGRLNLNAEKPTKADIDELEEAIKVARQRTRDAMKEGTPVTVEAMAGSIFDKEVQQRADIVARAKPLKLKDREKWFADREAAIKWLRAKGVSGQDVLTTYLPELRKIKTDTTRAEKRDRLKAALRGL